MNVINRINCLVSMLLVWAPIGAQTFEKTISATTQDFITELIINDNDEIVVISRNISLTSPDVNYYPYNHQNTHITILNEDGTTKMEKRFYGQDFGFSIDSNYSALITTSGISRNNNYIFSSILKADTPLVYTSLFFQLDSNLRIINYNKKDTFQNLLPGYYRMKDNDTSILLMGFNYDLNNGNFYGKIGFLGDSLEDIYKILFNTADTIFMGVVYDALINEEKNMYVFGNGKYSNGFTISPMQLIKLDSNYNLIKKAYIHHPLLNGWESTLQLGLSISSFWISDTTFLLATTGPTEFNRKGDIHFFIYDTALQQKKYKRIITPDTSEFNYENKTTTYDSICNCFYMGVTKRFKNYNSPIYGTNDTTDFQLIKFDKNLNIIFKRFYRRNKTLTFTQLITDSKGNVIMAGQTQDINSLNPSITDIFILKVDSNGNYLTNGLNRNDTIDFLNYSIFPNPVKDQFTFRQYNVIENYTLKLFDLNGKLQKEFNVFQSEVSFSIKNLSRATYLYQLINSKGKIAYGKIVKE